MAGALVEISRPAGFLTKRFLTVQPDKIKLEIMTTINLSI